MSGNSYDGDSMGNQYHQQPPLSVHSDESSNSGITWLLSVMDSPYTLPPLDALIRSNAFRRGTQVLSEIDHHSTVGKSFDLESLQRWTRELESVAPSTNKNSNKKKKNLDSVTLSTSENRPLQNLPSVVSPYISHKVGSSTLMDSSDSKIRKQNGREAKDEIIGAYAEYLRASQISSPGQRNQTDDIKRNLSIAIASHISKEAASKSKARMARVKVSQREKWSTARTSRKGTFEAMAREKESEELSVQIFSGVMTPSVNKSQNKEEMVMDPIQQNKSLLENPGPTSNHDPLYRIMREESEIAMLRHRSNSQVPNADNVDSLISQNRDQSNKLNALKRAKAAAIYDKEARTLLREQVVISAQMIRGPDLTLLRKFGSISPDMWITLRAVYFLFVSYYESIVMRDTSVVAASVADSRTGMRSIKGSENHESLAQLSDEQFFMIASQSMNIGTLWDLIGTQCREYDMTSATVAEKFSWHMLQALLAYPDEFSCALVYIERGEDTYDTNMISILAGRRISADFWRTSRFYQLFPEDNLSYLRTVVSPTMFTPLTTAMKSIGCARLCAWARRITAGLYSAKNFSSRNVSKYLYGEASEVIDLPFFGNNTISNSRDGFINSMDNLSFLDVSVHDVSVFDRSNLSLNSPKKKIEQFVNYPGTSLGPGLIHKGFHSTKEIPSDQSRTKSSLSIIAFVPISIYDDTNTASPSLFDEHICIFNAAMLLARPSDRVEILLMNGNEKESSISHKSHGASNYHNNNDSSQVDRHGEFEFYYRDSATVNMFDNYSLQMANIFARNYYEKKMFTISRSPLHRVILESEFVTSTAIFESPTRDVSVSFNDIKCVSEKNTYIASDSWDHSHLTIDMLDNFGMNFSADLLVVDVNGFPFSNLQEKEFLFQKITGSLALVFARHWAFVLENTFPISRFVVFISESKASYSAFMLTLQLAKPCDLIFLIHAIEVPQNGCYGESHNEKVASMLKEYRKYGYNVHIDYPTAEYSKYPSSGSPSNELAMRLVSAAREYEPTHVLLGADSSDIVFAMTGPGMYSETSNIQQMSLSKQMTLIAADGSLGSHTLLLVQTSV